MKKNIKKPKNSTIKNIIQTKNLNKFIVNIVTGVLVSIFVILAMLSLLGIYKGFGSFIDFFVFALLSGAGIYGTYQMLQARRISKIDAIFPEFIRDLAESRRAGMTFTRAILFASKGNYGLLTPEIQKISQQVSWGGNINDALRAFAQRVHTKSIERTITLIIEASLGGGNVADVLDVAAKDAREIKMLEKERKTNMMSYVIVIYVGIFVFLAIVLILLTSFVPAMVGNEGSQGLQGIMGGGTMASQKQITGVFYLACTIQAFGSALVAGVFEDGRYSSSVKHIFIMVLSTWLMFKLTTGV
jgi:archaeal flagellar protein FlaJ